MGALTSKESSFELRDWDVINFESVDPTDVFGSSTRLYIKEKKVTQIESCFDSFTGRTWITDRGRQFFDSIFKEKGRKKKKAIKWLKFFKAAILTTYLSDYKLTYTNRISNKFLTVIFENLGLKDLSYLKQLATFYSFFKIRSSENNFIEKDFEAFYQLNDTVNNSALLNKSTLCLLVNCNTRHEGYSLNLNLKKRETKGDFKCINLHSKINLTFNTLFLNSNFKNLNLISTGNHLICRELKTFKNPVIIFNTEFFKRNDKKAFIKIIKLFKFSNILTKSWLGFNTLSNSLTENNKNFLNGLQHIKLKDFNNFSFLYFIHTGPNNMKLTKKIINLKLAQFLKNKKTLKKFIFANIHKKNLNFLPFSKSTTNTYRLPTANFYESEELYVNAEGIFCNTQKIIKNQETKNIWQIFRKLGSSFKELMFFVKNQKENIVEIVNFKSTSTLKNFLSFLLFPDVNLTNSNLHHVIQQTQSFLFTNEVNFFKNQKIKIYGSKFSSWINNFFISSKDEYSVNSSVLQQCGNNTQILEGTFF